MYLTPSSCLCSCCCFSKNCKWSEGWRYSCSLCQAPGLLDSLFHHCYCFFSTTNWCHWVCYQFVIISPLAIRFVYCFVEEFLPDITLYSAIKSSESHICNLAIKKKDGHISIVSLLNASLTHSTLLKVLLGTCRSRIRETAEKQFKKVPSGDTKPKSWTLLDFGKKFGISINDGYKITIVAIFQF